jgi:hypothetical protein
LILCVGYFGLAAIFAKYFAPLTPCCGLTCSWARLVRTDSANFYVLRFARQLAANRVDSFRSASPLVLLIDWSTRRAFLLVLAGNYRINAGGGPAQVG